MADRRSTPEERDPDARPTEEEVAAAATLREHGDPLVDALRAAWSPGPIDERAHAALLDETIALDADELALATALRDALAEDPIAAALTAAWRPTAVAEAEHEAILARVVGATAPRTNVVAFRIRRAALATTTVLAFAASVVVWIGNTRDADVPLAHARSTQALFDEPFRPGETSARIDRIAMARATDLRDNQFAKWGAK